MEDWSQLTPDMLREIQNCVTLYSDKIRLSCVCKTWRSALPRLPSNKFYEFPSLLFPFEEKTTTQLFNLNERKVLHLNPLDQAKGKLFKGSSHGWVVLADYTGLHLVNPLTKAQIQLPSRTTFPYFPKPIRFPDSGHISNYLTKKIVVSADPASRDDYVAVAIYGQSCRLAYCKKGYNKWVCLHKYHRASYEDVLFFEGKLYALTWMGNLIIFEFGDSNIKITELQPKSPITDENEYENQLYIAQYSGGILMIQRVKEIITYTDELRYRECGFNVYKLDNSSDTPSWREINCLGGDMLFVGLNESLSISSQDFSELKGNRIYFTSDNLDYHLPDFKGGFDTGVYNLDNKSIEPLPGYKSEEDIASQPIWIIPNPRYD